MHRRISARAATWSRHAPALALLCLVAVGSTACKRLEKDVHAAPQTRIHVDSVEVVMRSTENALPVTGTLEALLQADLAANATGKVLAVAIERGEEVKKGAVLARLDVRHAAMQAAAAKAQADVSTTQASLQAQECARLEKLANAGAIPMADYEKQQWMCKASTGAVTVSQLQANVAMQAVTDGVIRAPFDGSVIERFVQVGEFVVPNTKVATVVSLDPLRLKLSVPEAQLAAVTKDLVVSFRVASFGPRVFSAKVLRISPIVRTATRDVLADAEVANGEKLLRPGMFATVQLPLGATELPVVPKTALVTRDGNAHLFVVRDGKVEERAVQLGPAIGDEIAIVKGLAKGDRVVRAPTPAVKNGALVQNQS